MAVTHTCTEANLTPDTAALQVVVTWFHAETDPGEPPSIPVRCAEGSYHLWSPTHQPGQPLPATEPPPAAALEPLLDHTTTPGDVTARLHAFHTELERHLSCQVHIELHDPLGFALPWCHAGEAQAGSALPLVGLSGTRYGTLTLPAGTRPGPQDWWLLTSAALLLSTTGRDVERERGSLYLQLARTVAETSTLQAAAHHLEQTFTDLRLPVTCSVKPGGRLTTTVRTDGTRTSTDIPLPDTDHHLRLCHQPSYDSWLPPATELELLGAYVQAIEDRNAAAAAAHTHLAHLTIAQLRDTTQVDHLLHELRNHTATLVALLDLLRADQLPQPALLDNLERTAARLSTAVDTSPPPDNGAALLRTARLRPGHATVPELRDGPVDLPASVPACRPTPRLHDR